MTSAKLDLRNPIYHDDNAAREHLPMLPPRREDVKPPIKKVENA